MQRLILSLVLVFVGCFATPPTLDAQDATGFFNRGNASHDKGESLYKQGLALYNAGKCREAVAAYSAAIIADPNNPAIYASRAMALFVVKDYEKAIADCDQAIQLNPNYAGAYSYRGLLWWFAKAQYDKAIDDCNHAIRLAPNFAASYSVRASAWTSKGEYGKAVADCEQAIRLDPNATAGYDRLAWIQAKCPDRRFRDGRKAFENASRACNLTGGKEWMYLDTLAAAYAECGDFKSAKLWESKAIDGAADDNSKQGCRLCLQLYEQGKTCGEMPSVQVVGWIEVSNFVVEQANGVGGARSYSFGKKVTNAVLRCPDGHDYILVFDDPKRIGIETFTPGHENTYTVVGGVAAIPPNFWPADVSNYLGAGTNPFQMLLKPDGTSERRDVSQAILVRSIAAAYNTRGFIWNNKGEYDKAILECNQALAVNPEDATAYDNRGYAWNHKGEYDKAIADFNQALTVNPNLAAAYNNRGYAWRAKGEYDKAIADFNQAIRLSPNLTSAYGNRGFTWDNKREYDKAIADYNQALAINPESAVICNNRGNAWKWEGHYDKAVTDYKEAIRLDPKYALAYIDLAFVCATCPDEKYRDGQKAVENAQMAYRLDGGKSWSCFDAFAVAYAECGDFEKAKEWEAKAIELVPDENSKRALRPRLELYKQGKPYRSVPFQAEKPADSRSVLGSDKMADDAQWRGARDADTKETFHSNDSVVVLANTTLRRGQQVLAEVPKGTQLQVGTTSGAWVGVHGIVGGREQEGWVERRVVTISHSPPMQVTSARETPNVQLVGWIDSRTQMSLDYTDDSPKPKITASKRYDVLRCSDGHDYLLRFENPAVLGTRFNGGPANIYTINGTLAALSSHLTPTEIAVLRHPSANDPTKPDLDVSQIILVESIQPHK